MSSTTLINNPYRAASVRFVDTFKDGLCSDWNQALKFGATIQEGDADVEEDGTFDKKKTHHVGKTRLRVQVCAGGPNVGEVNERLKPPDGGPSPLDALFGTPCHAGQDEVYDNAHHLPKHKCAVCLARLRRLGMEKPEALRLCSKSPLDVGGTRPSERIGYDGDVDVMIANVRALERSVAEADANLEEQGQLEANAERGHEQRKAREREDREKKMVAARAGGWDGEGGWEGYKKWKYPVQETTEDAADDAAEDATEDAVMTDSLMVGDPSDATELAADASEGRSEAQSVRQNSRKQREKELLRSAIRKQSQPTPPVRTKEIKGDPAVNLRKAASQKKTRQTQKGQLERMVSSFSRLRTEAARDAIGVQFMPDAKLETRADCGLRAPGLVNRVLLHMEDDKVRINLLTKLLCDQLGGPDALASLLNDNPDYPVARSYAADLTPGEEHMAHAAMSGEASWYPLVASDGEDVE